MGKLTSTIGIPIKLLNEAQVRGRPLRSFPDHPRNQEWHYHTIEELFCFFGSGIKLRLQTANSSAGPCRYARNHIGSRLPGEVAGRYVDIDLLSIGFAIGNRTKAPVPFLAIARILHNCLESLPMLTFSLTAEDNMNVQLKDITVTARDGRVSHLDQVYIRGSHVRFFIVPDMLRYVKRQPASLKLIN